MNNKLIILSLVTALALTGCSGQNDANATTKMSSTATESVSQSQSTETASTTSQNEQTQTEAVLAPDFTLMDMEGNSVTLSDLKGEKVYIKFWASF